MNKQTATKLQPLRSVMHDPLVPGSRGDDYDFPELERRRFRTLKEYRAYLRSLPTVELQFDSVLKQVKTSIRLSQRTIDGYDDLAQRHGLRSGQTLMKMVLEAYLTKQPPKAFG